MMMMTRYDNFYFLATLFYFLKDLAKNVHINVCQFWWVWLLWFRRYGYLLKTAKFPFRGMDYSPWSRKNSIDQNRLKKFMQLGVDVMCMHTSFGGRDPFGFGDMATFQNGQISLSGHGL